MRRPNPHAPGPWYHGTSYEAALGIMATGRIDPPKTLAAHYQGKKWFAPVPGLVYVTSSIELGCRYAQMRAYKGRGKYGKGVLIEVSLTEPCIADEDEIGHALDFVLHEEDYALRKEKGILDVTQRARAALGHAVLDAVPRALRTRWEKAPERGLGGWSQARVAKEGKAAQAALPPDVLARLSTITGSVGCRGVRPIRAWIVPPDYYRLARDAQTLVEEEIPGVNSMDRYYARRAIAHAKMLDELEPLTFTEARTKARAAAAASVRAPNPIEGFDSFDVFGEAEETAPLSPLAQALREAEKATGAMAQIDDAAPYFKPGKAPVDTLWLLRGRDPMSKGLRLTAFVWTEGAPEPFAKKVRAALIAPTKLPASVVRLQDWPILVASPKGTFLSSSLTRRENPVDERESWRIAPLAQRIVLALPEGRTPAWAAKNAPSLPIPEDELRRQVEWNAVDVFDPVTRTRGGIGTEASRRAMVSDVLTELGQALAPAFVPTPMTPAERRQVQHEEAAMGRAMRAEAARDEAEWRREKAGHPSMQEITKVLHGADPAPMVARYRASRGPVRARWMNALATLATSELLTLSQIVASRPDAGDLHASIQKTLAERRTTGRRQNPDPTPPKPMPENVARPILEAYERVGGGMLTTATAKPVLRAWLQARGWTLDRFGNYLSPTSADRRQHFKEKVLNEQEKFQGVWRNRTSTPLIDQAMFVVQRAAEGVGDAALLERVQGSRAKKKAGKEKAVSRAAQQAVARKAADDAMKILAFEEPALIAMNLRGETMPDADYARLGARAAALKAEVLAGRKVLDADVATIDRPPVVPVFRDKARYRWVETVDGVPYTVEIAHSDGDLRQGAQRHQAKVAFGSAGGHLGVDPVTHGISLSQMGGGGAVGDAILTGTIAWSPEKKRYYASIFFISASEKQRGTGSRLMGLWCRMIKGYGLSTFIAEAVGPEGLAFFQALERRGALRIKDREGAYWLMECVR
jgi:hypothetical protein